MSIGLRRAQERVQRVFQRMADLDMPLFGVDLGALDDAELVALRDRAEQRAAKVGRSDLIDEAFDRIAAGYASRMGDSGRSAGIFGITAPTDARQLAAAQIALQDLVLAVAAEDLLTPDEAATLGAAGELLLQHGLELPEGWIPPPDVAPEVPPGVPEGEGSTWSRGEVVGAILLVALAVIAGWLAMHDVMAGLGLGFGVAVFLFLWRRERPVPNDEGP